MKKAYRIFPLVLAFLLTFTTLSLAQYKVIRVVDGGTIVVDYRGRYIGVKFLCVDTTPMERVASDYTIRRLNGKYVELEFKEFPSESYDRILAYVFVDGANFNLELVRQGLSPYYAGSSQEYDQEFREAEKYAIDHKLNIWGDPELTERCQRLKSEWNRRKSQNIPPPDPVQKKEWKYVASKNSEVFHRPSCGYVGRIKPRNLIGFDSREEAIKSGRKPCKVCKP